MRGEKIFARLLPSSIDDDVYTKAMARHETIKRDFDGGYEEMGEKFKIS